MSQETIKSMVKWCNRGNPSSGYASAKEARSLMEEFRQYVGRLCGFNPCCMESRDGDTQRNSDPNAFKIIFTSGASEANCTVLAGVVAAYTSVRGITPHIIMSAIEHKSLHTMAEEYERDGRAEVTFVQPTRSGHIRPEDVAAAFRDNTCLVCVMQANNETGAINDIAQIGRMAHEHGVPFHCDTVQSFGKMPEYPNPIMDNLDSFCISFHKLGGPPGIGALIIRQQLLLGYKLQPLIYGTQNEGVRGGTENLPGIGAAYTAIKQVHLVDATLKPLIMRELSKHYPTCRYTQYDTSHNYPVEIVFMSGASEYYLSGTLLLSVVKRYEPYMCNTKLKEYLESKGIIVSVGSACNTASAKASHVLYAMGADKYIRKGAIRVSIGADNTVEEIKKFIVEFLAGIKLQLV